MLLFLKLARIICHFFFAKRHIIVSHKKQTRKETRLMMTTTMMMKSVVASSDYNYYRLNVAKASTTSNNSGSSKTNNNKLDRRRTMLGLFGVGVSSSNNKIAKKFSANASSSQQQKENAENAIAQVLKDPQWPPVYPFTTKDMGRYDESSDAFFYEQPRLVKHIDDQAIDALTKYYSEVFKTVEDDDEKPKVLDICSSWISHYPEDVKFSRCAGTGMNEEELLKNPRFTEKPTVVDLNETPKLPYEDDSFDFVTNAVSVDYLTKPLEVMQEVRRVLKPGGRAIMSFSNRCFPTKAVSIWTATGDLDHIWIVGAYFHFATGFDAPEGIDISPNPPGKSDPMYVVTATKSA
tara:strand:+ start:1923 stop:2969 length:1047 start_codon:yes stop_codon:yes gene_type:complete